MCQNCERIKAQRQQTLSHANEIAELAILATGEIDSVTDALKLKLQLDHYGEAGLLDPANMLLLIAHFASQNKELEADNKRLHETLSWMPVKEKSPEADANKMSHEEALRIVETIVNTFELAQTRAMAGANAQIRELKNRFGLNK